MEVWLVPYRFSHPLELSSLLLRRSEQIATIESKVSNFEGMEVLTNMM